MIVAAPFPPLNEKYIGKIWPATTANAQHICNIRVSGDRYFAIIVGNTPFKISSNKTNAPYFFPRARTVFVAPAFPLPIVLISIFLSRHIIVLVDIEPIK